jgi:hypothetical protein
LATSILVVPFLADAVRRLIYFYLEKKALLVMLNKTEYGYYIGDLDDNMKLVRSALSSGQKF